MTVGDIGPAGEVSTLEGRMVLTLLLGTEPERAGLIRDFGDVTVSASTLFIAFVLVARRRFTAGTDPRDLAGYLRQAAEDSPTLRRREAEAALRHALGEPDILAAADPKAVLDIAFDLLPRLLSELSLPATEVTGLVVEAEALAAAAERYLATGEAPGTFGAGRHDG